MDTSPPMCKGIMGRCIAYAMPDKKLCEVHFRHGPDLCPQELTPSEQHQARRDPFALRPFPRTPWDSA